MTEHVPVLLKESVEGLNLKKNSTVMDATADGGGHSEAILKKLGGRGKLVALDWDRKMAERLHEKFRTDARVKIFHSNFRDMGKLAKSLKIRPDAIFFDLGLSSLQLVSSGRGFSFQTDEPLTMTYDEARRPNAQEFIKNASVRELERVLRDYGEESWARQISRRVVEARKDHPIRTTGELAEIIVRAVGRRGRIHPATKTFQALRIYLNDELENLTRGLEAAWKILKPRGRIAVISFHSLEDRIIKNFFRGKAQEGQGRLIIKKPLMPGRDEILSNPRARSAKLRIIEKIK
ncbi:16S rRNA (cytosine(1402)-N(4))-methyltransferase RsmH [Candidatus Giovannonibacteria bacterium]|nr:16S rRNA (cytosine(1402)-N(4))-methyltransferase RsmH [Candidatus Giovannonibacteria bacterium]